MIHTQTYIEKKKAALEKKSKICIHCKKDKPIDYFTTDRKHLDGKHPVCRECKRIEQRALYKKQPERFKASNKRAYHKSPEKARARQKLNNAVRLGKIEKPTRCQLCGEENNRIEGHHHKGYSFPLDVTWLCTPCHKKIEKSVIIK